MWGLNAVVTLEDRGGRRSGLDRRSSFVPGSIPERRSGQDRRNHPDRRIREEDFTNLMVSLDPKRKGDAYLEIFRVRRMFFFGSLSGLLGLLTWAIIISIACIFHG